MHLMVIKHQVFIVHFLQVHLSGYEADSALARNAEINPLTFMNRASYRKDGHTATLQTPHFKYLFYKYTYWTF
jgi:hypothetical protein